MKFYILIISLLLLILVILTGCKINSLLNDVEEINLSELQATVLEWVNSHMKDEGIYLARVVISAKVEEYYLYVNKQDIYSVSIGNEYRDENNSLSIKIEPPPSSMHPFPVSVPNPITLKVYKIVTNRPARYIILDGEKIEVSTIEIIDNNME